MHVRVHTHLHAPPPHTHTQNPLSKKETKSLRWWIAYGLGVSWPPSHPIAVSCENWFPHLDYMVPSEPHWVEAKSDRFC